MNEYKNVLTAEDIEGLQVQFRTLAGLELPSEVITTVEREILKKIQKNTSNALEAALGKNASTDEESDSWASTGTDAYEHCAAIIEQWQTARKKAGLDTGTIGSLAEWICWVTERVDSSIPSGNRLNEAFEKWFLDLGQPSWELERPSSTGEYVFSHVDFAWRTWVYCFLVSALNKNSNAIQKLTQELELQAQQSKTLADIKNSPFHAGETNAYRDAIQKITNLSRNTSL